MFRPPGRLVCPFRIYAAPRLSLSRSLATTADTPLRTALFFPGHGVQRKAMTVPWLEAFPKTCRPFLEETDHILKCNLSQVMAEGTNEILNKSKNAQPAIMAVSIMILKVLEEEFGFKTKEMIDVTLGHSLGEYAALVAAGYLEYPFALTMVRRRGEIMGECTRKAKEETGEKYGMIALVCEEDIKLESLITSLRQFLDHGSHGSKDDSSHDTPAIDGVRIANINSRNQIVLSGSLERIRNLLTQIREFAGHDPRAVEIRANSPFHSPLMEPAYEYMRTVMRDGPVRWPGELPTVSNVTARPFESEEDIRKILPRQTIDTVQWWSSLVWLDEEKHVKRWLGVGPGKVGRNLVGKQVGRSFAKGGGVWAISDPREIESTLKGLEEAAKEDVG